MNKGEFNLLHEKWILAMDSQNVSKSFSILEIFKQAHKLKSIAGELPTQDIAILRLLLSVLHTVFYRYSPSGEKEELEDQTQAIDRWRELWEMGEFPYSLIEEYLLSYEDKFYLFHDEYPFLQVRSGEGFWTGEGKKIEPNKPKLSYFIGEVFESKNKVNLFKGRHHNETLQADEAARWLLHMNSFDLSPSGNPGQKLNGYKNSWLGKLGLVYLKGATLFQTLMLNLVLGTSDEDDYIDEKPLWEEVEKINGSLLAEIDVPLPKTLNKLYSMRFRFIELVPTEDRKAVVKVLIWSGCKFADENQFIEPMTAWETKKNKTYPKKHSAEKRVWEDFGPLIIKFYKNRRRAGVLDWVQELKEADINGINQVILITVGQQMDSKSSKLEDVFSDGLSIHSKLIEQAEEGGLALLICDEVNAIEKIVDSVGLLAKKIEIAKGESDGNIASKKAKEQAYSRLDAPFRQWLESINPETDDMDEKCREWREYSKQIIRKFGNELVEQAGPQAIVGRKRDEKWYTASNAYNEFSRNINKI